MKERALTDKYDVSNAPNTWENLPKLMKFDRKLTCTEVVSGVDSTVGSVTCTHVQMHLIWATDRKKRPKATNKG